MFVCSIKAKTLRLFGIIALCVCALTAVGIIVADATAAAVSASGVSLEGIKTEEDRRALLSAAGIQVSEDAPAVGEVALPKALDAVLLGYNEIQKEQGFDLSKYKNKEIERYTYTVTNYAGYEGTVYANLLIYRGKIVGGDICSADSSGFVHGLEKANANVVG